MAKWDNSSSWWAENGMHEQRPRARRCILWMACFWSQTIHLVDLAALPSCKILFTLVELIERGPSHATKKEERCVEGLPHLLTPKPTLIRHEYLVTRSPPPQHTHTHASSHNRVQFIHISNLAHPLTTKPTHLSCVSFLLNDYKKMK